MISSRKQSCSFVTLQINARRHDYNWAGSSVQRAIKELYVTRDDRQAIGKRSPLVTPLGGKDFWEVVMSETSVGSRLETTHAINIMLFMEKFVISVFELVILFQKYFTWFV